MMPQPRTIEDRVLAALHGYTGVEEGGWHSRETLLVEGLTKDQVRDALYRLRVKGHTYVVKQRDEQKWLWFPTERV